MPLSIRDYVLFFVISLSLDSKKINTLYNVLNDVFVYTKVPVMCFCTVNCVFVYFVIIFDIFQHPLKIEMQFKFEKKYFIWNSKTVYFVHSYVPVNGPQFLLTPLWMKKKSWKFVSNKPNYSLIYFFNYIISEKRIYDAMDRQVTQYILSLLLMYEFLRVFSIIFRRFCGVHLVDIFLFLLINPNFF